VLAAIDIHKAAFQAAVLDPANGAITEERFKASREALVTWIGQQGELDAVAIEATTGWRWVARELQQRGIDVRLTDAGQASALQGARKRPKNDRLDARWLVLLLARELLPEAWLAPEEIQRLRDKTRLREGANRRSHSLGAAAARGAGARGLGVLAGLAADRWRSALGRGAAAASGGARSDRDDARRDGDARASARSDRLRAAPAGQERRAAKGAAGHLRDRADPGVHDSRRDR
jgi:hypothetical protein